ncbi:FAN-like, partial [Brachionus plicatilis]
TSLTLGKFFLITEVAAFVASYALWKRMNDSQEFRLFMRKNYPSILEASSINKSLTSRFSLILLEPGEIYFEDFLVYYHETDSPFDCGRPKSLIKGNLKICSKSFVFDPLDFNYPLIKFSYKFIQKIHTFHDQNAHNESSLDVKNSLKDDDILRKKCFAVDVKQTFSCKANNKIEPYSINKRKNDHDLHYFEFIFTNCAESLDLLLQLHRASTLDYEQEEIMIQLILKSCLNRNQFKFDLHQLEDVIKEQIQFEYDVNRINPLVANPGKLALSNMCIYFKPFNNLYDSEKTSETNITKIKLMQIKYVIKRRYHLRKIGLEIQYLNSDADYLSTSYANKSLPHLYLTFENEKFRDSFYDQLTKNYPDKLINFEKFNNENMLQKWRYGLISNYEYLMYLNNTSDRSFNDLTQYPVFPWVLSDYTSQVLDLDDPSSYRDLSRPIGALNTERLDRLKQRFDEFRQEDGTPPFLYGSHYSTPAFVLFYLVREQPEWQLCLQNGKFDHPNRLFHSIADTWRNCLTIDSDVKELIPEFYDTDSLPHFLNNHLDLDLGVRQNGERVNDVILPQWAHNNAKEFIQKMRDALESPHVSSSLHHWIDLIWGFKQQGDEAVKANNLFYYLCYEGAVDLDQITNYSERKSLELQIQEFGQIPTQLFKQAHLPKSKMLLNESEILQIKARKGESNSGQQKVVNKANSPSELSQLNFELMDLRYSSKIHKSQVNELIFIEQMDKLPLVCSVSNDNWIKIFSLEDRSIFRSHNETNFSMSSVDIIQIVDQDASYMSCLLFFSCWNNSFYVYDMNYNRCIYCLEDAHDDAISKIRLIQTSCSQFFLLTSSWDSTIKIWQLNENFMSNVKINFVTELSHDSSILTFDISEHFLGTICFDGTLFLYRLNLSSQSSLKKSHSNFLTKIKLNSEIEKNTFYSLANVIHSDLSVYGKIVDCKLLNSKIDSIDSVAFCTSLGFIKIFKIDSNTELFSFKLSDQEVKLNKLLYLHNFIIACDATGSLHFLDLQSEMKEENESKKIREKSLDSFFPIKSLKISEHSLEAIQIFKQEIICVGDSDGNLNVLSLQNI